MFDGLLNKPLINLFTVNDKNNSFFVRLNQIMSKLLLLGIFLQSSCLQIEQLFA